jgi:nucleoside-diphosphate kinase
MVKFDRALAEKFYEMHKGKHFFDALVAYVTLAPVVAMVLEGENAIEIVRRVIGATDPREALPGTVRGDFGLTLSRNIVHGSDSRENAAREIALLFKEHEIFEYARADAEWLLAEK